MFDENDSEAGVAVAIAIALAIFTALFAVGMATGTAIGLFESKAPAAAGDGPTALQARVARAGGARTPTADPAEAVMAAHTALYFDLGRYELPANALTQLTPLMAALRVKDGAKLVVSGYHDASGNAAANEELAKQRAFAVRDLLTTAGVPAERIELAKPAVTTGGADPGQARRVDVSVR